MAAAEGGRSRFFYDIQWNKVKKGRAGNMMFYSAASVLSVLAALGYTAVCGLCCCAATKSVAQGKRSAHKRFWFFMAACFGLLIALRLSGLEEGVRQASRAVLSQYNEYGERREFQRPLAAGTVFVFGMAALYFVHSLVRRRLKWPLSVILASLGLLAMAGLVLLRIISLHMTDALLYRGPHLNWIIDIGATVLTGLGAAMAIGIVPSPSPRHSASSPRISRRGVKLGRGRRPS